jgi:hypothetical protein
MPRDEDLRELNRRGARVVGSAPDGGITISVDQPISLSGLPVDWAAPLMAQDKISPLLAGDQGGADPVAVLVEFHPDVYLRRAYQLLSRESVQILRHPDLAANHVLVTAARASLPRIAAFDEVAYIFPASQDLIAGNHVMACAGMEMTAGPVGQYVTVGSGWGGPGPDGVVQLAYVFAQMSTKLPVDSAQSEIMRAFQEWAKYANIRFVPGTGPAANRTVSVMFASGVHGDAYPFPPGGQVLAHTFFPAPPNPEPIAGDMHLNEDENWQIGSGIDLFTVALHEAGHALGLGHTDDPTTIMYPYYRFGAVLSSGDIAGVQALYGSPETVGQPVTPVPVVPVPPVTPQAPALSITILNPGNPTVTTTASSVSLSGAASGGTGGLNVAWKSDQGGSGQAAGAAAWTIASIALGLGLNHITVMVTDNAGHTASALESVTRQAPVAPPPPAPPTPPTPSGPPSLAITSPPMSIVSTSEASITLSGTASASVTSVTWTSSTGASGSATGTQSWTAAGIPLLEGNNTITVQAYNAAGDSAWRSITVVRQ